MAALYSDVNKRSSKEKIQKAWDKVLKDKASKSKAQYMEHQ